MGVVVQRGLPLSVSGRWGRGRGGSWTGGRGRGGGGALAGAVEAHRGRLGAVVGGDGRRDGEDVAEEKHGDMVDARVAVGGRELMELVARVQVRQEQGSRAARA